MRPNKIVCLFRGHVTEKKTAHNLLFVVPIDEVKKNQLVKTVERVIEREPPTTFPSMSLDANRFFVTPSMHVPSLDFIKTVNDWKKAKATWLAQR